MNAYLTRGDFRPYKTSRFISINLSKPHNPGCILPSFCATQRSQWRIAAQSAGREAIFTDYQLRVAAVMRDNRRDEMSITIESFTDEFWVVCPRCSKRRAGAAFVRNAPGAFGMCELGHRGRGLSATRGVLTESSSGSGREVSMRWAMPPTRTFICRCGLKISCGTRCCGRTTNGIWSFLDEYVGAENRRSAADRGLAVRAMLCWRTACRVGGSRLKS